MITDAAVSPRASASGGIFLGGLAQDISSRCALAATFVAVVGLFAVSPITLEAFGIAYISPGGGLLSKCHPSTGLAAAALCLRCLGTLAPGRTAWRLLTRDAGVVLLLAAVLIAGVFALTVDKTPVTPLIDTFVLPILVFLLLRDLSPDMRRWLAVIVTAILVLNAAIAIVELLRGWRLVHITVPETVSADPTRSDTEFSWQAELAIDWRATALLGHPLANGLLVGVFILCLAAPGARWLSLLVRTGLIALEGASMFAFGARSALVGTLVCGLWLAGSQIAAAVARGAAFPPRRTIAVVLLASILVTGVLLLGASGFLDKTLERFASDNGSASTRLTMFSLLEPISWADLVFRPDKDVVATWQRLYGLEFGIESSWLGLVLTYGLVVSAILIAGLTAFSLSVLRRSGPGAGVVLLLFFTLTSVTASMSGKTTSFAMALILIMLFLPRDLRGPTARRAGVV